MAVTYLSWNTYLNQAPSKGTPNGSELNGVIDGAAGPTNKVLASQAVSGQARNVDDGAGKSKTAAEVVDHVNDGATLGAVHAKAGITASDTTPGYLADEMAADWNLPSNYGNIRYEIADSGGDETLFARFISGGEKAGALQYRRVTGSRATVGAQDQAGTDRVRVLDDGTDGAVVFYDSGTDTELGRLSTRTDGTYGRSLDLAPGAGVALLLDGEPAAGGGATERVYETEALTARSSVEADFRDSTGAIPGKHVNFTSAGTTYTVEPDMTLQDGDSMTVQASGGALTIAAGAGVTITPSDGGTLVVRGNAPATIQRGGSSNLYYLMGGLVPA